VKENQERTNIEHGEVEGRQGACGTTSQDLHSLAKYGDRLVKLLIRAVNLNEEQRKEVERSLTQTVQHYLKFHHHPTVEPLRNTLLHSTRCPWSLSVLVLLSSQWNALH